MLRNLSMFMALCAIAFGQPRGTTPKPKPSDYPVQLSAGGVTVGAEYLVQSLLVEGQSFVTPGYLVVEVAVYPPKGTTIEASSNQFTLRINGKKEELQAQAPGMVAASLKYPDWEEHPGMEVGAGPVILGRQEPVSRFPGDRRPADSRTPPSPAPPVQTPGGVERQKVRTAAEAAVEFAYPDGRTRGALSGYVYFPYQGRLRSIKSLELIYRAGEQPVSIRFF